jgi:regulatory protein
MAVAGQNRISAIKQQVKRSDRYSIFIDGDYVCSLSEGALLESSLRIGQELSKDELYALKDQAQADKAYDRTIQLIARRPRSEWEVQQYLKRKSYDEEVIQQTTERLVEKGYLDDVSFAQSWIQNRRLLKPRSKRKLRQELLQKRVPEQIITDCLAYDETDDKEVLRQLIEQKRSQTRYKDRQKLMQYLSGQGFSYGDIKKVLEEIEAD